MTKDEAKLILEKLEDCLIDKHDDRYLSIDAVDGVLEELLNQGKSLPIDSVVGRSEQLPILDRCGCEEPNEEPIKVCMNCNGYVE